MCAREMAVVRAILVFEVPGITKTYAYAYSNILKILQPKKGNFQIKESDIFLISAQKNRQGGSNEYPHVFSKLRKIMYTPVNPSIYWNLVQQNRVGYLRN